PWQLFALYGVIFAIGSGVASITPVSLMVSRAFPGKAGLANGVASAGMSAGQLVIIALFTLVLAHFGWRYVFAWGGLAHLVLLPLVLLDQSPPSTAVFGLVFGFTFLMTAPLLVIFVSDTFGTANLGAISGLIVMIHHMCGGLGAWIGAAVFDARGGYDVAFAVMAAS